ncbi:Chemoreceptor zinc-binding domain [Desulfurella multipotens]|uniref:Chemoreceptor zinc-binding domain n=1 Tax=Desulfurella multipotens TaxID=79269 RepID=A0A1G6MCG7_9BACT|nr:CZB domain-containing protein [Desulfurella multipotens]SDC53121.1 Chemoreceptor zinc-binding domain [Desulfurella multipotens]
MKQEGIENEYLFFLFNYLPCDLLQGYFISKPIPYHEFINFVKNFKPDSTFIEFQQNNSKILNLKIAQVKYFIYKYFKIIRNILQNNDSDKQLNDLSKIIEFDHKKCDFGKWYYSVYPLYEKNIFRKKRRKT